MSLTLNYSAHQSLDHDKRKFCGTWIGKQLTSFMDLTARVGPIIQDKLVRTYNVLGNRETAQLLVKRASIRSWKVFIRISQANPYNRRCHKIVFQSIRKKRYKKLIHHRGILTEIQNPNRLTSWCHRLGTMVLGGWAWGWRDAPCGFT